WVAGVCCAAPALETSPRVHANAAIAAATARTAKIARRGFFVPSIRHSSLSGPATVASGPSTRRNRTEVPGISEPPALHSPHMRVLIAEDQPTVAAAIARGLRNHGAAVDVAHDGAQALHHARLYPYDVLLLDRDLPRVHGDDVCRALRDEQPEL